MIKIIITFIFIMIFRRELLPEAVCVSLYEKEACTLLVLWENTNKTETDGSKLGICFQDCVSSFD